MSKRNRGSEEYRYGYGGPWGTAGMFGPWFQVMRMWNDAMWQFVPGGCPPASMGGRSGRDQNDEYCGGRLSVEVTSPKPIKVSADLDPDCYDDELTVDDLEHLTEKNAGAIEDVKIECRNGRVYVRLVVAGNQAAGEYRGAIRDDDDRKRGKVWVVVEPEEDKGGGKYDANDWEKIRAENAALRKKLANLQTG